MSTADVDPPAGGRRNSEWLPAAMVAAAIVVVVAVVIAIRSFSSVQPRAYRDGYTQGVEARAQFDRIYCGDPGGCGGPVPIDEAQLMCTAAAKSSGDAENQAEWMSGCLAVMASEHNQ